MEGEQALQSLHTKLDDLTSDVDRNKVKTLEVKLKASEKDVENHKDSYKNPG